VMLGGAYSLSSTNTLLAARFVYDSRLFQPHLSDLLHAGSYHLLRADYREFPSLTSRHIATTGFATANVPTLNAVVTKRGSGEWVRPSPHPGILGHVCPSSSTLLAERSATLNHDPSSSRSLSDFRAGSCHLLQAECCRASMTVQTDHSSHHRGLGCCWIHLCNEPCFTSAYRER
jgi:hypothetical protein